MQQLNLTVGLTPEQSETNDKRAAYDCDVTYGTGHEFEFDYLRDQLTLRREASAGLGARLLHDLQQTGPGQRSTMPRGLNYAVVDEADSVMIDDAGSPLLLSMSCSGAASDLDAHLTANEVSQILVENTQYRFEKSAGLLTLTEAGQNRCYEDDIAIPTAVLLRSWTAYVEQALRARHLFRRDVHYVLTDNEVRIVDETTGRIFEDRSWQDGLHRAIEAREGLPVTLEKASLAQISRQRFFRLYQNLCGMTGTATECEPEFKHVYRSKVTEIALRLPSQRNVFPTRYFATQEAKQLAIVNEFFRIHATGQPLLVGTQSISDSEAIAGHLE